MMAFSIRLSRVALVSPAVTVQTLRLSTRSRRKLRLHCTVRSTSIPCELQSDVTRKINPLIKTCNSSEAVYGTQSSVFRPCAKGCFRHLITRAVDGGDAAAELSAETMSSDLSSSKPGLVEISAADSVVSVEKSLNQGAVEPPAESIVSDENSGRQDFVKLSADSTVSEETSGEQGFAKLVADSVVSEEKSLKQDFADSDSIAKPAGLPASPLDSGGRSGAITVPMAALKRGAVFKGTVIGIQSFGAFVSFGAFADGLVHVSKMSSSYVRDVRDFVSIGQEVTVTVLNFDKETGRISLSMQENDDREFKYPFASSRRGETRERFERPQFQPGPFVAGESPLFQQDSSAGKDDMRLFGGRVVGVEAKTSQDYGGSRYQQGQDRNSSLDGRVLGGEANTGQEGDRFRFEQVKDNKLPIGGRNYGAESQELDNSRFQPLVGERTNGVDAGTTQFYRSQQGLDRNTSIGRRTVGVDNTNREGDRFRLERTEDKKPVIGAETMGKDWDATQIYRSDRTQVYRSQQAQERNPSMGGRTVGVQSNTSQDVDRFRFDQAEEKKPLIGGGSIGDDTTQGYRSERPQMYRSPQFQDRSPLTAVNKGQEGDRYRFEQAEEGKPSIGGSSMGVGSLGGDHSPLQRDRNPSIGGRSIGVDSETNEGYVGSRFQQGQMRTPAMGGRMSEGGAYTMQEADRFRFQQGQDRKPSIGEKISGVGPDMSQEVDRLSFQQGQDKTPLNGGRITEVGARQGDKSHFQQARNPVIGGRIAGADPDLSQDYSGSRFQQGQSTKPSIGGRIGTDDKTSQEGDRSRFQQDSKPSIWSRTIGAEDKTGQEGHRFRLQQDLKPSVGNKTMGPEDKTAQQDDSFGFQQGENKKPLVGGKNMVVVPQEVDVSPFQQSRYPSTVGSAVGVDDSSQDYVGSRFKPVQDKKPSIAGTTVGVEPKTSQEGDKFRLQQGQNRRPSTGERRNRGPGAEDMDMSFLKPDLTSSFGGKAMGLESSKNQAAEWVRQQQEQDVSAWIRGRMSLSDFQPSPGVRQKPPTKLIQVPKAEDGEDLDQDKANSRMR